MRVRTMWSVTFKATVVAPSPAQTQNMIRIVRRVLRVTMSPRVVVGAAYTGHE